MNLIGLNLCETNGNGRLEKTAIDDPMRMDHGVRVAHHSLRRQFLFGGGVPIAHVKFV